MIVYGVISYLLLAAYIAGYFIVKKWADKAHKQQTTFVEDQDATIITT
jgi:hypothetical protein